MNEKEIYLQIEKHKEDMLKSDVKYWIERYDIKYQQNKENYDKLKECEQQLRAYKDKEDKLREYIDKEINQPFTSVYDYEQGARDNLCQELYKILNEGSDGK